MLSEAEASMKKTFLTKNSTQTKKLGESFAKSILKRSPTKRAIVFGLIGDLGGGKTTFLQGFAKGLGVKEKILSPTFVIMRKFRIQPVIRPGAPLDDGTKTKRKYFFHIDCYRVEKSKELFVLGFKEIIFNPKNIVAIEWADRISKILPKNSIILKFEFIAQNKRKVKIGQSGRF